MQFMEVPAFGLGANAREKPLPMQCIDVPATFADIDDRVRDGGFEPNTSFETNVANFMHWYRDDSRGLVRAAA
jgi:UDP-glucuronate 4-epimerase